jgi:hypothetical protein
VMVMVMVMAVAMVVAVVVHWREVHLWVGDGRDRTFSLSLSLFYLFSFPLFLDSFSLLSSSLTHFLHLHFFPRLSPFVMFSLFCICTENVFL